MVIGLLCAVIFLMIDPPPLSEHTLKDEFPEWNEFGLDAGHDIGSFVPIDQGIIKSAIATRAYLMDQLSESSFLNIKPTAVFDEKQFDYKSTFTSDLTSKIDWNKDHAEFSNEIEEIRSVDFTVYGVKQKAFEVGTIALKYALDNLPKDRVELLFDAVNSYDSVIFITEVLELDSSKYSIIWSKQVRPNIKSAFDRLSTSLGTNSSWNSDNNYSIVNKQPRRFMFKFEVIKGQLKNNLFKRRELIVAEQRLEDIENAIVERPVRIDNWSSGRIDGKSWRFTNVDVFISESGKLTLKGEQSTNRLEGFYAAIGIQLLDKNHNVIDTLATPSFGVKAAFSGSSSRIIEYSKQIEKDILKNLNAVELVAIY